MKKRILTFLVTAGLLVSMLAIPAGAAESTRFSDVSDQNTAAAIEVLRLMGVLDGYGDGTFRPANHLTRAQFCKMVTYMMDGEAEMGRYRTVTVFPDVKPSYWAAGYINLAAKGKGVIAGYADGKFYPDRTVTVGQAVTILLRLLGYKDEAIGGVWPDSYMAVGAELGLTDGIDATGNTPLTRAQAAKLFLNLLDAQKSDGGTLYTLSKETTLYAVDGSAGTLETADDEYPMAHPVSSTSLIGSRGYVILNGSKKALTFLPTTSSSSGGISNAAIVVYEDRSTAGFSDLAGTSNYTIYKNGTQIGVGDLRKNDVAVYSPATNSIRVCDTRVSVYYESCEPSPAAPTTIKVLGGTEFQVLPTATESISKFKPGQQMTLLLTADGRVAAATSSSTAARSNAVGIVSETGSITLLCGTTKIPLAATAEEQYRGQIVRISSSKKDTLNLYAMSGGVSGDLDISAQKLGSKQLADNVMIFDGGKQITLAQITSGIVKEGQITAARTNWAGKVDLIVLNGESSSDIIYGRAIVRTTTVGTGENTTSTTTIEVVYGNKTTGPITTGYAVQNGDYVAATVKNGQFTRLSTLAKLNKVSADSWVGTGSVLFGGRSYTVADDVLCYNLDSKDWVTLEQALAYANTANLYVKDGIVRIVEVSYK